MFTAREFSLYTMDKNELNVKFEKMRMLGAIQTEHIIASIGISIEPYDKVFFPKTCISHFSRCLDDNISWEGEQPIDVFLK